MIIPRVLLLVVTLMGTTVPSVEPDHSLTLIEYAAAGVPSPDRPWTIENYRRAITALRKLDASRLPREDSPKSRALFLRMASSENLEPLIHPSPQRSWDERIGDVAFVDATAKILVLYPEFDERFSSERAALAINALRAIRWTVPLVNEGRSALPRDNPGVDNTMRLLEQVRGVCGEVTYQLTRFLQGDKHLSADSRVALARAMTDLLPAYIGDLPAEDQRRIWDSFDKAWNGEHSEAVRDELKKLSTALRKPPSTRPSEADPGNAN